MATGQVFRLTLCYLGLYVSVVQFEGNVAGTLLSVILYQLRDCGEVEVKRKQW